MQKITPFLWFDDQAEAAVNFYISIFKRSMAGEPTRYEEEGSKVSDKPVGSVMTIPFEIAGQQFVALNGGPHFKFNEAISFVVNCQTQQEVDYYWDRLSENGDEKAQQCGWLKDKFGVSWQIVPIALDEMLNDPDPARVKRVMKALLQMKKIDLSILREAYEQREERMRL